LIVLGAEARPRYCRLIVLEHLIAKSETAHARLDAQDVVVHREQLLLGSSAGDAARLDRHCHLGVIDTREVAGAGGLVLLGLQGEGIHVDAWVRAARVVHEGLVLVEVLAQLLLETVLAVEDNLELIERASLIHGIDVTRTRGARRVALLNPGEGVGLALGKHTSRARYQAHIGTGREAARSVKVQVGHARQVGQNEVVGVDIDCGVHRHLHVLRASREVPQGVEVGRGGGVGVYVAPHELLHWVVEGQANQLEGVVGGGRGVTASVLDLLDQVLVALLGEAATLLSVKVHIVGPDLEIGAEVGCVVGSQVEIKADLVVLQGNQGQVQARVAVEEEQQRQVHAGLVTVDIGTENGAHLSRGRDHLAPAVLVGLVEENLSIQAPPGLVVLVDALATDGHLDIGQGALGDPARVEHVVV